MEFTYSTKSENKKVVIGSMYSGKTFVDVYPDYTMHTSNIYKTYDEGLKRFNSIKKRVKNQIIK
tara:strand:- start:407 stop:598 length:192 start_codon:yes stop_codon:yes gene_type:complete